MAVSYRFDEDGNELPPETRSVSWVNDYIKSLIEEEVQLQDFYVCGEISNFKSHSSGHLYFTLKDENSEIRAVMFKTYAIRNKFVPQNGMKVIIHARVGVYEKSGSYQLYVDSMQPDGLGSLYLAYEQLKSNLAKEGLFDESHKKQIPKFPKKIGIITSPTGAAVRDIIKVCKRRCPFAELVLFPSAVQGDNASSELINAIEYFTATDYVDIIIIGRGGGSIEDLWAFNNEKLARAIFKTHIPVISAVGHEIDFTICDFVADARAATPSHAAEMATPDVNELKFFVNSFKSRAYVSIKNTIDIKKKAINDLANGRVMKNPVSILDTKKMQLFAIVENMISAMKSRNKDLRLDLSKASASLNALSPLSVLSRGYGAIFDTNDKVIKSIKLVYQNDKIKVKLIDGTINATVDAVESEEV